MRKNKLQLEFPGQHVARADFWTPDGSRLGFEGCVQQSVFEFSAWALAHPLTPSELALLERVTEKVRDRVRRKP